MDFWEKMEQCFKTEPAEHSVYLYRTQPRSRINGSGGYLAILTESFTEEDLKKRWGGYQFRAMLNRGRKCVCATSIEIEAPPKLDEQRELNFVTRPGDHNGGGNGAGTDTPTAQLVELIKGQLDSTNPAHKEALKIVTDAAAKANEMLLAQMPKQPTSIEMMTQLATLQKMMNPGNDDTTKLLLAKVIDKAFATPADNSANSFDAMLKMYERISGLFGGGGGAPARPSIGERIVEALPSLVDKAIPLMDRYLKITENNRAIAEYRMRVGGQPMPAAQPAPRPAIPVGASTAPAVQPTQAPGASPLQTVPLSASTEPAPAGTDQLAGELEQFLTYRIVTMIRDGFRGDQVYNFISGANPMFAAMLANANEVQIREFLASNPILKEALALPEFDQFLSELLEYISEEKAEAVAENAGAAAAAEH
jgi:hypothetical protein